MERINSYCENCQITITSHVFHNLLKYFCRQKRKNGGNPITLAGFVSEYRSASVCVVLCLCLCWQGVWCQPFAHTHYHRKNTHTKIQKYKYKNTKIKILCLCLCWQGVWCQPFAHTHYHSKYENNLAIHNTDIVNRIAHMSPHNTSSNSAAKCKVLLTIDIELLTIDIA